MKYVLAVLLNLWGLPVFAQNSPVGLWKTVDDKTGREEGLVRIVSENGALVGRIEASFDPADSPNQICDHCTDDRKDQPMIGLTIMRGVHASSDEPGEWDGGKILDPDTGTEYRVRLHPRKGGKELEVRGYIGLALFGRTQVWLRAD